MEGRAGWSAVLPNEKYEFSTGWRAAQKGGPAGCTTGRVSGLHIKVGCTVNWAAEKGGPEGCPFLKPGPPFSAARWIAFLCGPPFCLLCSPPTRRKFTFFIWKHGPPARPALQLVLSTARRPRVGHSWPKHLTDRMIQMNQNCIQV